MKTISLIGFIGLLLTLTNSSNISTKLVPKPKTTDELVKSRKENGRYVNSFNPKFKLPNAVLVLMWKIGALANKRLPDTQELDKILPVIRHEKPEELNRTTAGLRFIWIGHASCYVQMNNFRFLVDPVFR